MVFSTQLAAGLVARYNVRLPVLKKVSNIGRYIKLLWSSSFLRSHFLPKVELVLSVSLMIGFLTCVFYQILYIKAPKGIE